MVCSFCDTEGHNVRTCKLLKGAIGLFITHKGATIAQSDWSGMLAQAAGLALDTVTFGMASAAAAAYNAYKTASASLDLYQFNNLSMRERAKKLKPFFGQEAAKAAIEDEFG
jgi:hypothetical protein